MRWSLDLEREMRWSLDLEREMRWSLDLEREMRWSLDLEREMRWSLDLEREMSMVEDLQNSQSEDITERMRSKEKSHQEEDRVESLKSKGKKKKKIKQDGPELVPASSVPPATTFQTAAVWFPWSSVHPPVNPHLPEPWFQPSGRASRKSVSQATDGCVFVRLQC
ncbi:hypothetical protein J4Q44_G00253180 [Coregonus suidteri]|uniref:Uncharacterized protein n=1 Tax=Coregonus suidteri TaxID=861788 RepID=A0AAN8QX92_9TELE